MLAYRYDQSSNKQEMRNLKWGIIKGGASVSAANDALDQNSRVIAIDKTTGGGSTARSGGRNEQREHRQLFRGHLGKKF